MALPAVKPSHLALRPPVQSRRLVLHSSSGRANTRMKLEDYKTVLYRQEDGSWVADIPSISGCYALMSSREEALAELNKVFAMIAEEYREKGIPLPADTTEIVHA